MSRKLLILLLPELKTVRVVCQRCGGGTEIRVNDMRAWDEFPKCRACRPGNDQSGDRTVSVLFKFATTPVTEDLHVELVIPDESAGAA